MTARNAPQIFAPSRRLASRKRMLALQAAADAPRYLMDDMVEDVLDRIAFVRLEPSRALVIGDYTGALAAALAARGVTVTEVEPADGFDEESPFPDTGFDLIASLGTLDTVSDLPGALIHLRHALVSGGMVIASFLGAGSLPSLRATMLTADGERPAPRIHPQVDVRAGAQLLQRAGFVDPVADGRTIGVRFGSLERLVKDLRAQAGSNVIAEPGPTLGKAAARRAKEAFATQQKAGKTIEIFEIVTLTGWKR
jgi:hypothetical protein